MTTPIADWAAPADRQDPFTDILFNALLGFFLLFASSFMLIRPEVTEGKIDPKAEYLITASWADNHPDDVDLLVETPNGAVVWFNNREDGLMHLDRDDRGRQGDFLILNGVRVENPLNQETVTLRGIVAGEYVVNLLHYKSYSGQSLPVQLKVERLNPQLQVVYTTQLRLQGVGDEQTAVRFTLNPDGTIGQVSRLAKSLIANRNNK